MKKGRVLKILNEKSRNQLGCVTSTEFGNSEIILKILALIRVATSHHWIPTISVQLTTTAVYYVSSYATDVLVVGTAGQYGVFWEISVKITAGLVVMKKGTT